MNLLRGQRSELVATDRPAPPRPKHTQQQRRAATERRLLDSAVDLIATHGSASVSLADIGKAAGFSRGIVTHQFGTRDEMLKQVATYAQLSFVPPDSEAHGLDRLLLLVDAYLAYLEDRPPAGRAFLLMWGEAAAGASRLHSIFAERDAVFSGLLARHLVVGIQDGAIRANLDPAAAAIAILGQLRGIGLKIMLDPNIASIAAIRRETIEMIRGALRSPASAARGNS